MARSSNRPDAVQTDALSPTKDAAIHRQEATEIR
jgi:hypothetical protein